VLGSSDQGLWEWRIGRRSFTANASFYAMLGIEKAGSLQRGKLLARVHPDEKILVRRMLAGYLRGIYPLGDLHFRLFMQDEKIWRWFLVCGKIVDYGKGGKPEAIAGSVTDMTEWRHKESQLLTERQAAETAQMEAEKANYAKGRFLATASHDMRQPIQASSLFLSILKNSSLNDEQERVVRYLEQANRACTDLLDTFLNASRFDADDIKPRIAPTELHEVFLRIESEFATLALNKKLSFKLFYPAVPIMFRTDISLLMVILRNLISNAIHYTDTGGILVAVRKRPKTLLFQVWDTGVGIREEDMPHIYEDFFQVSRNASDEQSRGLGLGLPIASRLMKLLEYPLDCRSRFGHGSVFEFAVPRQAADQEMPMPLVAMEESSLLEDDCEQLRGKLCVVAENNTLIVEALSSWLEALGMRVLHFQDSEGLFASPEIDNADFFLVDLRLGGELNGIELLDMLRDRLQRTVRGIIITGGASREQVGVDFPGCAWPVLFKPVQTDQLLQALLCLWRREPVSGAA
jgi:signal transduction histidine kinase/CheY-like chemotaxis protein